MTLITFQSRIHFASNVLEEALRAELEEQRHRNVLILTDSDKQETPSLHRVLMGLPDRVTPAILSIAKGQSKHHSAKHAVGLIELDSCDVIIASGSARAILHGRKCRQSIAQLRYSRLAKSEQKTVRQHDLRPALFAIPGVDGLPDPCMSRGATADEKTSPPSVIICDPSLIANAGETDVASAFATALGRCLATLNGTSFNPLADGMAMDGLRRLMKWAPLDSGDTDTPMKARDLMAASLNAALAQQKGPGLIPMIANALNTMTDREVDGGALQRILLPRILSDFDQISDRDRVLVLRVMEAEPGDQLSDGVARILEPLPLARSLRDLGYSLDEVRDAAGSAQIRTHVPDGTATRLNAVLEDLY